MVGKKNFIGLSIFILSITAKAQDKNIVVKELADPEIEITDLCRGEVLRDLSLPEITYKGNETFLLFGPDEGFIDTVHRKLEVKIKDLNTGNVSLPIDNNPSTKKYRDPISIALRCDEAKLGKYKISVRSPNNNLMHIRSFRIVAPQPTIKSLEIESRINDNFFVAKDTLWIDRDKTFTNGKIAIEGDSILQRFKTVFIKNREFSLIQDTNNLSLFTFGEKWKTDAVYSFELGETSILFERKYAKTPTSKSIFITAPNPKILGGTKEYFVEEGQSKTDITLEVENVFSGAKAYVKPLANTPNFPNTTGELPITIDNSKSTLTFPLYFEPLKGSNQGAFELQVINTDGKRSAFKTIRLVKKQTTIKLSPLEANKPFLAGHENLIRFERLSGAYFNACDTCTFSLVFGNHEPIDCFCENLTENSFSANVLFPAKLPAGNVKFKVISGDNTWNGEIAHVYEPPKIMMSSDVMFKGGEVKIRAEGDENIILAPHEIYKFIKISTEENGTNKEFTIKANQNAKDFKIDVMFFDHVVKTLEFEVKEYPSPNLISTNQIVDRNLIKKDKVIVLDSEKDQQLTLRIPIDRRKIGASSVFYAQVYNKRGTPLGEKKEFYKDDNGRYMKVHLNTQRGLNPGDEFKIEISNPNEITKTFPAYIKRRKSDNWIITAGLSVIDYKFAKPESENAKAGVLDGVNFGFYYMQENYNNPSLRLIGYGPNILLLESEDNLKVRVGATLLFMEKVVLGLSYGQEQFGFLAGVNIELADLSSLLGN